MKNNSFYSSSGEIFFFCNKSANKGHFNVLAIEKDVSSYSSYKTEIDQLPDTYGLCLVPNRR
jgi:hypothetical protein